MHWKAAILYLLLLCSSPIFAQSSSAGPSDDFRKYFEFENPHPLACLFTYFPSILVQHDLELKSFVSSKNFKHIREQFGDTRSVDAIFIRAMQLTNNNTAVALLLSVSATLEHEDVRLKLPIFNFAFPLTSESVLEFTQRVANLPRVLYDDTPESAAGDRDKLQHFFGSAFLTFVSESRSAADRFGIFVEKGEEAFIVGGSYDSRDLRADWQGQNFGLALLRQNLLRPSEYFYSYPPPRIVWRDTTHFECEGP